MKFGLNFKTVEHSFYDYGGHSPNPCAFLSVVAARTRRVRLVTGAVIPAFHHPAHLGGELAMLNFGGSSGAEAHRTLELFAAKVMRHFN